MTLRPASMINAATRYCLEQQVVFDKPVVLLDSMVLRKMRLPATFKYRKRRKKRLALTETRSQP